MKKILVPTDFSKHAECALDVAVQIARKNNSEIFLLHVLELPHGETIDLVNHGNPVPEVLFFLRKTHEKFDKIKNRDSLKGIKIKETVQFQSVFKSVIELSKKQDIDLIVMGSKGSNGFDDLFVGSNTEKIMKTSDTPVLIIKKDYDISSTRNFVFASDFSEKMKGTVKKAIHFASFFQAHLNLLLINTPNEFKSTTEAELLMNRFVEDIDLPSDAYSLHFYNDTNIEKGILNFSNKINADLIGMCTYSRKGLNLNYFFNGSISGDLIHHTPKPVITFKI